MRDGLITFVIDGPSEFAGQVPAEDFLAKLRDFIAMIYAFDRAYHQRPKRSITLDLIDLRRSNPARVVFRPRAMGTGYNAVMPVAWAAGQLEKLYQNDNVDALVTDVQLETVVNFSHRTFDRLKPVRLLQLEFDDKIVVFDEIMEANALMLRNHRVREIFRVWFSGVSQGSLFGELRSVSDIEGDRQFVICPPTGPDAIKCVFPEELRVDAKNNLFKVVRVHGFLHFDGRSPHANRIEVSRIEGVQESQDHLLDLNGAFKDFQFDQSGDEHWPTI